MAQEEVFLIGKVYMKVKIKDSEEPYVSEIHIGAKGAGDSVVITYDLYNLEIEFVRLGTTVIHNMNVDEEDPWWVDPVKLKEEINKSGLLKVIADITGYFYDEIKYDIDYTDEDIEYYAKND